MSKALKRRTKRRSSRHSLGGPASASHAESQPSDELAVLGQGELLDGLHRGRCPVWVRAWQAPVLDAVALKQVGERAELRSPRAAS